MATLVVKDIYAFSFLCSPISIFIIFIWFKYFFEKGKQLQAVCNEGLEFSKAFKYTIQEGSQIFCKYSWKINW